MKVLIIGGTGKIGHRLAQDLSTTHQVIVAGLNSGQHQCDYSSELSLHGLFMKINNIEHVVCTVGGDMIHKKFDQLTNNDWRYVIERKLFAQMLVTKISEMYIKNGGSITLTSGYHSHFATPETIAIGSANAALETFVMQFSKFLSSDIRINAVSPTPVSSMKSDQLPELCPITQVARSYIDSIEGDDTGKIFRPWDGLYSQNILPQLYARAA